MVMTDHEETAELRAEASDPALTRASPLSPNREAAEVHERFLIVRLGASAGGSTAS
jgi:hypothetical protein